MRFRHSLVVAGIPGLIELIYSIRFVLGVGGWNLSKLLFEVLSSYILGLLLCLWFPYERERLHRKNYSLTKQLETKVTKQTSKIRDQKIKIRNQLEENFDIKCQLEDAQKVSTVDFLQL